ncbi:MAG: leucine--tRNA ligase [Phycisphaerales bacterium]|nr:leucine--tRNA ligase [Phycisphaerales bacterium]
MSAARNDDSETGHRPASRTRPGLYDPAVIEPKWQERWERQGTYRVPNPGGPGFDPSRPKFFILDMFPYPSGSGLHVGHPEGYTATDIVARYKTMRGFNVLHPMGWDAFGLPAEQYAIATGVHPAITTRRAIDTFRRQLKRFGFGYDWSREFATIDPDYYRWTQWIFLEIYNAWYDVEQSKARRIDELVRELESGQRRPRINPDAAEYSSTDKAREFGAWQTLDRAARRRVIDSYRLAYLAEQTVNWCPKLGTALANEEVTADGLSDRGHFPVFRKPLKQWMFRITAYADRLLDGLNVVDWPDSTRTQQIDWIGRSEGAEIDFPLAETGGTDLRDVPAPQVGDTDLRDVPVPQVGDTDLRDMPAPQVGDTDLRDVPAPQVGDTDLRDVLVPQVGDTDLRDVPVPQVGGTDLRDVLMSEPVIVNPVGFECRDPFPKGQPCPPDLQTYRRTLPHLELEGATYFVTWCTASRLQLDAHERDETLSAILHWDDRHWRVYAACVMPDHVHVIVRPYAHGTLRKILDSIKRFSATQINKKRGRKGSLWQDEGIDHIVRDGLWFSKFLHYLVWNPVEAGLCGKVAEYPWTRVHKDAGFAEWSSCMRPPTCDSTPQHVPEVRATKAPAAQASTVPPSLRVFTTRPDTIFGATYMVVAPEHPLVVHVLAHPAPETDTARLRQYVESARHRGDVERMAGADKAKTGVFTGLYCINPANHQAIPVWTADYVLMSYGTGAIMAVPGQDPRDWDFAHAFGLPVIRTVQPPEGFAGEAFLEDGPAINSEFLNGLRIDEAKSRIIEWLEQQSLGKRRVQYKLRDWLFSRQRYWGEPFPIVFDEAGNHYPVEPSHLPVVLPQMADYQPVESDRPQPLLAKATQWMDTTAGAAGVREATGANDLLGLSAGTRVHRESNTMPGWAGSCWYYLRYGDPKNVERFASRECENYWMGRSGVDLYIGGSEHAVLHLLYARFWHKVLFDLGHVGTLEPFRKLFHQGLITSFAYQRADKSLVPVDEVEEVEEGKFIEKATGRPIAQVVAKMSKSLKNVVNPDDIIAEYGADTFRLYEMFMGPLESSKPWNTRDVGGLHKLCNRIWRLFVEPDTGELSSAVATVEPTRDQLRILHKTIKHVTEDIENLKFNTAIARLFDFVNALTPMDRRPVLVLEPFLRILAPFAPHLAEELHERLRRAGIWQEGGAASGDLLSHQAGQAPRGEESAFDSGTSVTQLAWPTYDESSARDDEVEIAVQILGKVKAKIMVSADADESALEQIALADATVREQLAGKTVRKVIAVKGRLVNIVAN